jgi:hypothetical protein
MKITVNPTQANAIYTLFTTNGNFAPPGSPGDPGSIVLYSVNGTNVSDVIFLQGSFSTTAYWIHHTGGFTVTEFLAYFPNTIQVDDISS